MKSNDMSQCETKDIHRPTTVFRALALSLNISEDFFLGIHKALLRGGGSFCKLRSLYYPAIANVKPGVTRCGEHSDYGTLTFLFQDSLGGLQIRGVGGEWLDAEPIEGSILVKLHNLNFKHKFEIQLISLVIINA